MAESSHPLAGSRGRWLITTAVFGGTALLFAQVATFAYTFFDDPRYVTENPRVLSGLSWDNVAWAFTTFHFSNWHPLTWLSYMADVEVLGAAPGGPHLVNALLHAADSAILFLVLDRMTGARARSAFVAVLFAVHPIHVESVAWVAERKDVLSTLIGLLALWAYSRYAERRTPIRYALVTVLFAGSLTAKPMWVTFPFIVALLDVWPCQRVAGVPPLPEPPAPPFPRVPVRVALLEKVPWLVLSLASAALTVLAQTRGGAVSSPPLSGRLTNAMVSYARYVGKMLWPVNLAAFYPPPLDGYSAAVIAGAATLFLLAWTVSLRQVRSRPWLAVGWAWFVGALVPVIGIVQIGGQSMADRYAYMPSIGLLVALTWTVAPACSRVLGITGTRVAAASVIAVLAVLCVRQTAVWADHLTLFRHAVAVTGPNARAHAFLSDGLRKANRLEEALAEAWEAVRIEPKSGRLRMSLAIVQLDAGRMPDAYRSLQEAVALDPRLAFAWALLGELEAAAGRPELGEPLLVRAVELAPDDSDIADRLARVRAYRASTKR